MYKVAYTAVSLLLLGVAANNPLANVKTTPVAVAPSKPAVHTAAAVVTASAPVVPVAPAPVMVTVNPGDSLSSIAQANNTTYARIFDANDFIADPNVILPGQQLRIPTDSEDLPDRIASVTVATVESAPAAPASSYQAPQPVVRPAVTYAPLSDNAAKAFIYAHESGNNPNATSPNGCYGLGQDCNGRVRALCGADYNCQDAFFTNYAVGRYGSWEAAAAFWQTHGWW